MRREIEIETKVLSQVPDAACAIIGPLNEDGFAVIRQWVLLPESLEKAVLKRQQDFLLGRGAAKIALEELSFRWQGLPIRTDRSPVWPEGAVGTITHSQGVGGGLVASNRNYAGLGIDMESLIEQDTAHAIRKQVIDEIEWDELIRRYGQELDVSMLVTLAFSAKESLYKCLAPTVGRFFGFKAALLVEIDLRRQRWTLELTEDLHSQAKRGSRWQGFWLNLCSDRILTCLSWRA